MNIKRNIRLSVRHLLNDRVNSVINITGLIVALGVISVVLVFVLNEVTYNRYFVNNDRIYRVLTTGSYASDMTWGNSPYILAPTFKEQFAEIEAYSNINNTSFEVKKETEYIGEDMLIFTQNNFFEMFGISLKYGNLDNFDKANNSIVLSESLAAKYFEDNNPTGRTIEIRTPDGSEYVMEVVGVFNDLPNNVTIKASAVANTNIGFEVILNNMISVGASPTLADINESWAIYQLSVNYLLLKRGASVDDLTEKISQFVKNLPGDDKYTFTLQPLNDIYFGSNDKNINYGGEKGNIQMIYILVSVGLLVLLIACINYMNLTSAQTISKIRNIVIRKIYGASRKNLIGQAVFESVLVAFVALPFAVLFAHSLLPYVSSLFGKSYELSITGNLAACLSILALIAILTGVFSSLFISLRATLLNPVETLKGKAVFAKPKSFSWRTAMIVFQIVIFMMLISSVLVMRRQINYAFSSDIGIKKEGLIRLQAYDVNVDVFKDEILKNPDVLSVSGAMFVPPHKGRMVIQIPKVDEPEKQVEIVGNFVDFDFVETMGMTLLRGDSFVKGQYESGVLVNETAIKELGLTEVIGEQTAFGTVIGVVSDFNMYSIHNKIPPMIIGLNPSICREIAIRINTDNIKQTTDFIAQAWKTAGANMVFDFGFTDDMLQQLYESDLRFSKLISLLTIAAIFIACLGLFGVSLLLCKQRTKEIGIRKVNGAKLFEVIMLLNSDFVKQVAIAFVIAMPTAWYFMSKWLEGFAYKTELSVWIFLLSGVIALIITILTVSWQSWRVARRNPVVALRYE